ncbi:MAG: hypothetical protein ACO3DK_02135, partial [Bacteroidia bacterium]
FALVLVAWTGLIGQVWPMTQNAGTLLGYTVLKTAVVVVPLLLILYRFNISEDVNSLLQKAQARIRQML